MKKLLEKLYDNQKDVHEIIDYINEILSKLDIEVVKTKADGMQVVKPKNSSGNIIQCKQFKDSNRIMVTVKPEYNPKKDKNADKRFTFTNLDQFKNFDINMKKRIIEKYNEKSDIPYVQTIEDKIGEKEVEDKNYISSMIKKLTEDGNHQMIFTGAPGTGKTYNVLNYVKEAVKAQSTEEEQYNKYYKMVQFHASYDYSDFVEGLRPVVIEGQENNSFVRLDGVFKEFCRKIVEADDGKKYYFIIDEINRADLSKVFGELMFGLEESYRGKDHPFDTQYKNIPTYTINDNGKAEPIENDCFKDGFYIPENLVIIGTMNDIDRSVETFDFALRRRFRWIDVKANEVMLPALLEMRSEENKDEITKLADNAIEMNKIISNAYEMGLNESYNIGPAYFKNGDKNSIWTTKVEPILYEYCRGRKADKTEEFIKKCEAAFFNN